MKKVLYLLFCFLISGAAFAQKVKLGIRAGVTQSYLHEDFNGTKGNTAAVTNFMDLGVYADFKFGSLSIQPGLVYFLKGGGGDTYSYSNATTTSISTQTITLHYAELPVNVIYNFPLKAGKIFVGAGPYMAFAIAGNQESFTTTYTGSNNTTQNTQNSQAINFGNGVSDFKRLDFGINTLAGFRFNNGLELGLAYGIGLSNIYNTPNYSAKNVTASFTVGYFFK